MFQVQNLIQKNYSIDFIIMIIAIIFGGLIGIINGIEEPVWIGKKSASIGILISSILFFGFRIFYLKEQKSKYSISLILFLITFLISLRIGFHKTKFNSEKWKSSLNMHHFYADTPAHNSGNMVEDIVANKLVIGKSEKEIIKMLGKNYFTENHSGENVKYYFYKGSIFDGCDKLWIEFENSICIKSGISGCD
jgi:hypothetical protein